MRELPSLREGEADSMVTDGTAEGEGKRERLYLFLHLTCCYIRLMPKLAARGSIM